ncbi:MAG TPA: hypothetical protein VIJ19_05755 [Opitutaceae bacterium]
MDDELPKIEPGSPNAPGSSEPRVSYTAGPPSTQPGNKKDKSGCGAMFLGGFLCVLLLCALGASGSLRLCLIGTPAAGVVLILNKRMRDVGLGILITFGVLAVVFLAVCGRGLGRM